MGRRLRFSFPPAASGAGGGALVIMCGETTSSNVMPRYGVAEGETGVEAEYGYE